MLEDAIASKNLGIIDTFLEECIGFFISRAEGNVETEGMYNQIQYIAISSRIQAFSHH